MLAWCAAPGTSVSGAATRRRCTGSRLRSRRGTCAAAWRGRTARPGRASLDWQPRRPAPGSAVSGRPKRGVAEIVFRGWAAFTARRAPGARCWIARQCDWRTTWKRAQIARHIHSARDVWDSQRALGRVSGKVKPIKGDDDDQGFGDCELGNKLRACEASCRALRALACDPGAGRAHPPPTTATTTANRQHWPHILDE